MLHGTRITSDLDPLLPQVVTGGVHVGHSDGDMAEAVADVVLVRVPVVGQLDDGGVILGAVTHEGVGEAAGLVVLLLQDLHPQSVTVEFEAFIQVLDPNHGVNDSHGILLSHGHSQISEGLVTASRISQPFDRVKLTWLKSQGFR